MSKLIKKIVAVATSLTVVVMLAPVLPVKAITADELQVQIDALLEQLAALQTQLGGMEGGTGAVTISGVPAGFSFDLTLSWECLLMV